MEYLENVADPLALDMPPYLKVDKSGRYHGMLMNTSVPSTSTLYNSVYFPDLQDTV